MKGIGNMLGALGALAVGMGAAEGGGWSLPRHPREMRDSLKRHRADRRRKRRFRKRFHRAHMRRQGKQRRFR